MSHALAAVLTARKIQELKANRNNCFWYSYILRFRIKRNQFDNISEHSLTNIGRAGRDSL